LGIIEHFHLASESLIVVLKHQTHLVSGLQVVRFRNGNDIGPSFRFDLADDCVNIGEKIGSPGDRVGHHLFRLLGYQLLMNPMSCGHGVDIGEIGHLELIQPLQIFSAIGAPDDIFQPGIRSSDVRAIDYDDVAMLNVSATQELAKRDVALAERVAALEAENARLKAQAHKLAALEFRYGDRGDQSRPLSNFFNPVNSTKVLRICACIFEGVHFPPTDPQPRFRLVVLT
jgi:hypothetical protein